MSNTLNVKYRDRLNHEPNEWKKKKNAHTQLESHFVGFNKSDRYAYNCRTQPTSQFDCNFVRARIQEVMLFTAAIALCVFCYFFVLLKLHHCFTCDRVQPTYL